MKRSQSKKKPAAKTPSLASREERDPLQPGDVVMLPDGAVAAIEKIVDTDAYVVEWTKQIGRGPWIFPVSDLVRVS